MFLQNSTIFPDYIVFCQSQICNNIHDKNNDENRKICQSILPMMCCRCFVEISLISIILFLLSKGRKYRNAKENLILTKNYKNCYDRPQVKLIGKFQTISHATSWFRLDSAEGLSKILSYKVIKPIESNLQTVNTYLLTTGTHSYFV